MFPETAQCLMRGRGIDDAGKSFKKKLKKKKEANEAFIDSIWLQFVLLAFPTPCVVLLTVRLLKPNVLTLLLLSRLTVVLIIKLSGRGSGWEMLF